MRRKNLSSAAALAGFVSIVFSGTVIDADAAAGRQSTAPSRSSVRQTLLNGRHLIAYAPPAAASGDYLEAVSQNGMHRWAAERMPLKVYIEEGVGVPGYRPSMKQLLVKAFDEWCRISNGRLSWVEVSSPNQADIACSYSDRPRKSGPNGFEAGVTNTIIQQNRFTGQSSIVRATMAILTQWRGKQFSDSEIYMTELHEVGHAMGMQGHSNVPSDLMYSTVNRQQSPVLTQRDANTIAKLYRDYGTQPSNVAYSPRRNAGGYPQMAPRNRNFGGSGGGVAGRNFGGYRDGGAGLIASGALGNGTGANAGSSDRVVEADGLQPFTPVEPQGGGRFRGNDRFSLSDADQGASGGLYQGSGQGGRGFGAGGRGFGPGFGSGQGWRSQQRARWRNLDPAQRAALRERMRQMRQMQDPQMQGFMPDGAGMSGPGFGGGMPGPRFGGGLSGPGFGGGVSGPGFGGGMTGPDFGAMSGSGFGGGMPGRDFGGGMPGPEFGGGMPGQDFGGMTGNGMPGMDSGMPGSGVGSGTDLGVGSPGGLLQRLLGL